MEKISMKNGSVIRILDNEKATRGKVKIINVNKKCPLCGENMEIDKNGLYECPDCETVL